MATLPVYDLSKTEVGSIDVQDSVFAVEVNRHLFYEVIKWQLAKRRKGTAKTKGRSEVRGGGSKPYRQKGTGRARQGSIRAPNHVGGGTVHGPQPRSYDYSLNKKVRKGAIRSALSLRASQQKLIVLRDLELESAKTKAASQIFHNLAGGNALIIDTVQNRNLELSVRNLPKVKLLDIDGVNLFDLLKHEYLVVTEPTVRKLEGALTK
jgi:large subunit ribosomal protein L4